MHLSLSLSLSLTHACIALCSLFKILCVRTLVLTYLHYSLSLSLHTVCVVYNNSILSNLYRALPQLVFYLWEWVSVIESARFQRKLPAQHSTASIPLHPLADYYYARHMANVCSVLFGMKRIVHVAVCIQAMIYEWWHSIVVVTSSPPPPISVMV